MRVGLIGNGAIARVVSDHCGKSKSRLNVVGSLGLPCDTVSVGSHKTYFNLDDFLSLELDVVVECAGSSAVYNYTKQILESGTDIIIISVGSLVDDVLLSDVTEIALRTGAKIIIPSGAIAGLDAISAAAIQGLDRVVLRSRKKPLAWAGAPGVIDLDLSKIQGDQLLFSGSARDAATLFPKNSNVAAALGLAGIGVEKTRVELIADSSVERNIHTIEASGSFGCLTIEVCAEPSPSNPKTSLLAALSINRQLDKMSMAIVI